MKSESPNQPDWHQYRRQFPVVENYVYFNHAAIALISKSVKEKTIDCISGYFTKGIVSIREFLQNVEQTRFLLAHMINASPSEIAFVKNTIQRIQIAANGIHWEEGDNVLLPANEFPANVFQWLNMTEKGIETGFIPIKDERFTVREIEYRSPKSLFQSVINAGRSSVELLILYISDRG